MCFKLAVGSWPCDSLHSLLHDFTALKATAALPQHLFVFSHQSITMSKPTLETLPNDVLVLLPKSTYYGDLKALSHASPQCYRNFQSCVGSVLRAIAQCGIPSEIQALAIAACNASQPGEEAASEVSDLQGTRIGAPEDYFSMFFIDAIKTFREEYLQEQVYLDSSLRNVHVLSRMYRLYETWDFFVDRFAQDAITQLTTLVRTKSNQCSVATLANHASPPVLSRVERTRLKRAFLRFKVSRKLFLGPELGHDGDDDTLRQTWDECIIGDLLVWEREGFLSIYLFLSQAVRDTFFAVEDDLLERSRVERKKHPRDDAYWTE